MLFNHPLATYFALQCDFTVSEAIVIAEQLNNQNCRRVEIKTVFEPYPPLQNSQLGPKKEEKDPKTESKSKVKNQGTIGNERVAQLHE